jgi:hypothetical protein
MKQGASILLPDYTTLYRRRYNPSHYSDGMRAVMGSWTKRNEKWGTNITAALLMYKVGATYLKYYLRD